MTVESKAVSTSQEKGSDIEISGLFPRKRLLRNGAPNSQSIPKQIEVSSHVDDRGFLCQIFGNYSQDLRELKRVYVVGNFSRGVIRGFHMHKKETKAYFVTSGSAKFIAARDSNSISAFVLSYRNPSVLVVPPTFYHGWISLDDNTTLVGLSDKSLEQSLSDDFRADPMKFGEDVWRVKNR